MRKTAIASITATALLATSTARVATSTARVAPATADAYYLSRAEACRTARDIVRNDCNALRVEACTANCIHRYGRRGLNDRMFVTQMYERKWRQWMLYLRIVETADDYHWRPLSNDRVGPLY